MEADCSVLQISAKVKNVSCSSISKFPPRAKRTFSWSPIDTDRVSNP